MNYRALKNSWLVVKGETEFTPGPNGSVIVPPNNSKVFAHWTNENGKLVSTYTITYTTLIQNKCKLISKDAVRLQIIEL
jgi:hypothetical protein